jgi:hypothetical protein
LEETCSRGNESNYYVRNEGPFPTVSKEKATIYTQKHRNEKKINSGPRDGILLALFALLSPGHVFLHPAMAKPRRN